MSAAGIDDDDEKWLMHVRSQNAAQLGDVLCKAARSGDVWRVETLLDMGVDINYREGRVLLNAAAQAHHKVVDLLIGRGLLLTQGVLDDALGEAAAAGDAKLVQDFLARGANAAQDDSAALMNAVPRGQPDVIRALLAAGADANAYNAFGAPALCSAISHGHAAAALLMLEYGADPAAMMRGMNALDWAISLGMKDVADTIRDGASGAAQNRTFFEGMDTESLRSPLPMYGGQTALHLAAKAGHFDVVRDIFLAAGAKLTAEDLMQKTSAGQTVLLLLAQTGQLERVFDPRLWEGRRAEAAALYAQHLPATHRGDIDIDRTLSAIDHLTLQNQAEGFQIKPRTPKPPKPPQP
jgi:ankyrin repeat protein